MIRDPRGVLLSQKNKWQRRSSGAKAIPVFQTLRMWANYHPVTISVLWKSGIRSGDQFINHPRVFHLRFEDLLADAGGRLKELCRFIGLDFQPEMLQVPQIGSSNRMDRPDRVGVDSQVAEKWRKGGLSRTEIFICQKLLADGMLRHQYVPEVVQPNWLGLAHQGITWIVKSGSAFLLNVRRVKHIREAVVRRFRW